MRQFLLAGVAGLLVAGTAGAADLPRKMPLVAPPPAWTWTGLYVGAFYGASVGQSDATTTGVGGTAGLNDAAFGGGLTLGYNWQFSPWGLVGVEGDIGYLGTSRSFQDANDVTTAAGLKSTWYSTLRGRLGYVTGPSVLYVTGGAAWVRLEETFGGSGGQVVPPTTFKTTDSGWTAGAGIETRLSRSWSATTEYLYIDLGSNSFAATTSAAAADSVTFKNQFHVLKAGLNYKFGEPFELPFMLAPLSSPQRWAGFYAGVNLGGGISNVHTPNQSVLAGGGEVDVNGTGFAGGGHVGYNMLALSNWIVGLEGDIGYLGVSHAKTDWFNTGQAGTLYQPGVDTSWYGTLRGRIGFATGPALLYATGGLAVVDVENSVNVGGARFSTSGTRTGWTFGGGVETELTSRLSARLESLYVDTGTETLTVPTGRSVEFKNRFTVVRAGLSYAFGGPDVVTARY